eukprot:6064548-Pleurochrysis_carterae.AAC.1
MLASARPLCALQRTGRCGRRRLGRVSLARGLRQGGGREGVVRSENTRQSVPTSSVSLDLAAASYSHAYSTRTALYLLSSRVRDYIFNFFERLRHHETNRNRWFGVIGFGSRVTRSSEADTREGMHSG